VAFARVRHLRPRMREPMLDDPERVLH
jgi:hypothetical protein